MMINTASNNTFRFFGLILFLLLLQAGNAHAHKDKNTIVFGVSLDLSGSFKVMSSMQEKGFRLWQAHVNNKGGILGQNVRVIVLDNEGCLETLKKHYLDMLKNKTVDYVFSPYSSVQNQEVVHLFEKYAAPVVASGASAPFFWEQGYRYYFGLYSSADRYAQGFLEIMSLRNINRIAVFYLDDPFSSSAAMGAVSWARRLGMDVAIHQNIGKDADSYLRAVEKAHNNNVQALIMCGYLESSILMRRAISESGRIMGAYFATVGPVSREYYDILEGSGENTFSVAIWKYHSQLVYPGVHRFNADFNVRFGHEPNYHAATAYAAGQLMEKALERAGGFGLEGLRNALAQMETFTIIGRYGVNEHGRQIRHVPFTIQWQQGVMETVWPLSLATSIPRIEYDRR